MSSFIRNQIQRSPSIRFMTRIDLALRPETRNVRGTMPMSAMPDDPADRESFYTKVLDLKRLNYWRRFPFKVVKSKRKKTKLKWLLMRAAGPYIKVNHYSEIQR